MGELLKGHIASAGPAVMSRYGALRQHLVFWDVSQSPKDNKDRTLKIGKALSDATRGLALNGFDADTLRARYCDGRNGEPFVSLRLFEPDNWMLRLHAERGRGVDSVWALRLIADAQNEHKRRDQRSTMVIDQCDEQNWAWLVDALRVIRRRTDVQDAELYITKSGFLEGVFDPKANVRGEKKRATLAFNVSKQAGFFTDGKSVVQWHHLFSHYTAADSPPSVCAEVRDRTLALRGDALIHAENDLAVLTYHDYTLPDKGLGYVFYGSFHRTFRTTSHRRGQEFPATAGVGEAYNPYPTGTVKEDPKSNHSHIDRDDPTHGLALHVHEWSGASCFPRTVMSELSGTTDAPTPAADAGTRMLPSITKERGYTKSIFPQGQITGVHEVKQMPHYFDEIDLLVVVPYTLSALLTAGQQMKFEVNYRKTPNPGDALPSAWTASSTVTLTDLDNPSDTTRLRWLMFRITGLGVNANAIAGGEITVWIQRRSDDSATADFELVGGVTAFFVPNGSPNVFDSNVTFVQL